MVFVPLTNSTVVTFPLGLPNQHLSGLLEPVEFQPALNLRGGINILLSCTTVIFTSVYTSYHPQPTRSEHAHIGQDNIPWHYLAYRIFILIVMPERMIFASLKDYWEARRHTNKFKKQLYLPRWSAVHSHVLAMGQFSHSIPSDTLVENCSPEQLASYSRKGILQDSDLPSVDELKELSKANVLVKVFTLFQILWLGIQCLARSLSHLPVTQIELIATSYAMYAVIAYIFWMDKPYHIERRPFVIHCTGPTDFDIHEESGFFTFEPERNNEPSQLPKRIPKLVITLIVSVIPFFAWNSVFPTMLEEDLWRIFSVSQVCALVLICTIAIIPDIFHPTGTRKSFWSGSRDILPVLGLLPRLILGSSIQCLSLIISIVGLSLSCMRAFPAGAYIQPVWMNLIPHFG